MVFEPDALDFKKSPYTGLTRESWIKAGEYLLRGIFQNIKSAADPVVMPRRETKITYPHSKDACCEIKAEYFEGLARSLFIAAPLIHDNPELVVCGYRIRDYYKTHILRACTRGDVLSVGHYDELQRLTGSTDSFRTFQQTVETCALVIGLWACRSEIWDTYTKQEKDVIAEFLTGYAHGSTVPQNWRLFNMLDMAFLHMEGYPIDADMMRDHAQEILSYYAGDGWYRDGHAFDYYSCWAFQVYAPIWNVWYGYEQEPYLAQRFEENSSCLMETYADFFDRDGFTNMWGRSNIYRNAATSALEGNFMLKNPVMDPGLARRIASGSLLQFMMREDFCCQGIPTMGFYGQFMPLVQGYSCAESPFWLGKVFLCLHFPEDHPFWTAVENNGTWERLREKETKITTLNGPALCFSNHQANGETILRTGKVMKKKGDEHGMWNYSKLCFNSKYPWEAAPREVSGKDMAADYEEIPARRDVESQQYVLQDLTNGEYQKCNVTFWHGEKNQVLYRRQFFNYHLGVEAHWLEAITLADFTVPYGVVRADKLRLCRRPAEITLGAYGFPDNGTEIIKRAGDKAKAIILRGHDFTGREKQLAMTIYDGWDEMELIHSKGTNPDSESSILVYAHAARKRQYGYESYVLISQVITKESLEDFEEEELFPIADVQYTDAEKCGGYGPVTIRLKDGTVRIIDFDGIEGKLVW